MSGFDLVRAPAARRWALAALLAGVPALAAGCGDDGGGNPAEDLPAVEGPTSPRLEVHATEMSSAPEAVAVGAGPVEVVLYDDGSVLHDVRIEDRLFVVEAGGGRPRAPASSSIRAATGPSARCPAIRRPAWKASS